MTSSPAAKQAQNAVAKAKRAAPAQPEAVKMYLIAYNLLSCLGWAYCLYRLVTHMAGANQHIGLRKTLFGESTVQTLLRRGRSAYSDFGHVVKWVQTAACLEIVHSAAGLVRSGLGTTLAQLSSRLLMVWYTTAEFPQVAASPFYASMVFAWSVTEVIRYAHYAFGLLGVKSSALEWLRYSLFYALYPIGAGSEAALILQTAAPARARFGNLGYFTTIALVSVWPPALLMMMTHMHKQRYKYVINPKGKSAKNDVTGSRDTPSKAIRASGTETPTRVTRSGKAGI